MVLSAADPRRLPGLPKLGGLGFQSNWGGLLLPPNRKVVAFVDSNGFDEGYDFTVNELRVPTLAAALRRVQAGRGDTIVVLPGHTENVTDATMFDNLVAGTRIIGATDDPSQDDAPTFRWTDTAGQWTIDQKNVHISGLKLRLEGANGVVKAINVTADACGIHGCYIQTASGATNKATIAIEVGSGGTNFVLEGNRLVGTVGHNSTDIVKLVGATVPSGFTAVNNVATASATAANGIINVTVAALNMYIANNSLYNHMTSAEHAIVVGNVAADGVIELNRLYTKEGAATAPAATGFSLGAAALVKCAENYAVGVPGATGSAALAPAADT